MLISLKINQFFKKKLEFFCSIVVVILFFWQQHLPEEYYFCTTQQKMRFLNCQFLADNFQKISTYIHTLDTH